MTGLSDILNKVCVIIPTYNNAGTLADVVRRTYAQLPRVIVVNDGSTDSTREVLEALDVPFTLVDYAENRGKGHALVSGFRRATELGYDYAITLDTDGQHYPEDIPTLLQAHLDNPGALLVGSRDLRGKDMSGGSVFANKFSNFWFTVQTACNLPDTQTGYRLYPLRRLHWMGLITSRYEAELELMVYASWHGVPLVPVPVNVYYPPREERVSHFRPGPDFARISVLNTVLCFGAGFYGYPRKLLKGLRATLYTLLLLLIVSIDAVTLTTLTVTMRLFGLDGAKARHFFHRVLCGMTRAVVNTMPGVKYNVRNPHGETFEQPAIIICNHQSHLDLLCAMALTPNLVIITKKWVWNNPLYSLIIRFAEYYPITFGYEKILEHCRDLTRRGYSVLIYPEGTRSADCHVAHFHRGAFYIAEELGLDILPIVECGQGRVMPKMGFPYLRKGEMSMNVMERIKPGDTRFGTTMRARKKNLETYIREEYIKLAHKAVNKK